MNLALLNNQKDAEIYLARYHSDQTRIIASGVDTFIYLKKRQIRYQRLTDYCRLKNSRSEWKKATSISEKFFNQPQITPLLKRPFDLRFPLQQALDLILLEILRNQNIAQRILKKNRPGKIYLSNRLDEPLLQKTHQGEFNLLIPVIILLCEKHRISVCRLQNYSPHYRLQLSTLLIRTLTETTINFARALASRQQSPAPGSKTNPRKKAILLSASNHILVNTQELINELRQRWEVIALGKLNRQEEKKLRQRGTRFININSVVSSLSAGNLITALGTAAKVFLQFQALPRSCKQDFFDRALPFSAWPIIEPYLAYCSSAFTHELTRNYLLIKQQFRLFQFQFILSSDNLDPFNIPLLAFASQARLPYGLIIHDAKGNNFYSDFFFRSQDTLFLWGNYQKRLIQKDFPRLRGIVTGHPNFDAYVKIFNKKKNPPNLTSKKTVRLLILSTYNPFLQHPNQEILFDVFRELNQVNRPSLQVTLKSHPSEDHARLVALSQKHIRYTLKWSQEDTDKLIQKHDIIITQSTSAGIHSFLHHQPTIYLNIRDFQDYEPYAREKAALGVYSLKQLIPAIQKLIRQPELLTAGQNRFILDFCHRMDGQASRRIANAIADLIQNS